MTHIALRKAMVVAVFVVIAAGVTAASIIGKWPWHWVLAGSLLGLIIFFKLATVIYPIRKVLKRIIAEEEAKQKNASQKKD